MKRISMIPLIALGLFCAPAVHAAPGDLDTSFNADGILIQDLTDYDTASSVAVAADGKIIVAGTSGASPNPDFLVARYLEDGSPDESFGSGGSVTIDFAGGTDLGNAMAIQPDGKIVVGGSVESAPGQSDFGLVRLEPNGALDEGFGDSGRLVADFGNAFDFLNALAVTKDGTIVAAGSTAASSSVLDRDVALLRCDANGDPDLSFDSDGKLVAEVAGLGSTAAGVAVQEDGQIVVSGYSSDGVSLRALLLRYRKDGSVDPDFDAGGPLSLLADSTTSNFGQVAVQKDGKIVAVGRIGSVTEGNDILVFRFEADGSADTSFAEGGKTAIDFEHLNGSDVARCVELQADGKILVGGETTLDGTVSHFALSRLNSDGSFDDSFSGDGLVAHPIGFSSVQLADLALSPDGRIVAAGLGSDGPLFDVALARYMGDTADLSLSFMETTLMAVVGDTATFTVIASNNGPDVAGGVVLTADIPPELELDGNSVTTTHGSCSAASDLVCEIGNLPMGEFAKVTYRAIAKTAGDASSGFTLTAQARDESSGNNISSLVTVIAEAEGESGGGCSLHRHP